MSSLVCYALASAPDNDHLGLLNVNAVPKIWPDLPSTVQTKLLALMRKVSPWLSCGPLVADMQLQLGLAFPVYLPKDGQSVPGMLVPALLPDRDIEVR